MQSYSPEGSRGEKQPVLPPNPFDRLARAWKYAERVALSMSILLVAGTVGYLSIHSLI